MRLASILSEAMRNIGSGAARATVWFLAVAVAGTLIGGFEAFAVIGQERDAVTRIRAAADVTTIVSPVSVIDGAACDRLVDADGGPQAAGAMREGDQITPRSTPGRSIGSYEVTAGMIGLLAAAGGDGSVDTAAGGSADADPTGVWVSATLAHDFGWAKDVTIETDRGDIPVAGVFDWPNDGRDTRFAYALVVPATADAKPFSECWAKQWPRTDAVESLLTTTAIAGKSTTQTLPGTTMLNKSLDRGWNAAALYETRMTRMLPWAALAVGLVIGVASVHRRRLEYAGALHCGQRKSDQLLAALVETLVWAGGATAAGLSLIAALCLRASPSDPAAVLLAAARSPLALFAGVLAASVVGVLAVRESRLFRLFKGR
ncbi:hypothetical protein COO72_04045 [Bifidobacterium callitrichos]|nr:hypothetical protein COO72_04045 [Bifidobacterium callitrichos]